MDSANPGVWEGKGVPEGSVVGEVARGGHDADGRGGEGELGQPQRQAAPRPGAPGQLPHLNRPGLRPPPAQTSGPRSAAMRAVLEAAEGGGSRSVVPAGVRKGAAES